jgi:hypothetical protein
VRPYREAQERFWAADRAYREQVARVIAKYGEPSRGVVETRVGGDMQQRDKVSAGNVYTYGSTVPVTDPDIMRAFIFRDLEYERHLAHARLLKMERATMSNPSAGEVARWLLRSLSTVTMAMRALNLAAAEHGTLSAWAYDRGAPVWAYDKSLPDQYKEPTEREQALYAYGWPLLPASTVKPRLYGLSFAPNGETPSGNGKWWQNYVGWSGLYWSVDSSDANLGDQGYAVGFAPRQFKAAAPGPGLLSDAAIRGNPSAYIADVDAFRLDLEVRFSRAGTGEQAKQDALAWGARWLDWLLSLGSAGDVWTSYFTGWLIREFNTGPNSALGPAMPITLYDLAKVSSDVEIAVTGFVTQIVQLVTLAISAVTGNYAGVLSALAAFGATAAQLGGGYNRSNVRSFRNPFSRWFSMPELNLDANNPSTEAMVQRLLGSTMPNYQQHLGIDFGLKPEAQPQPPPPPMPPPSVPSGMYREGPPPTVGIKWGTVGLIGGAIVGGALLLRFLRR